MTRVSRKVCVGGTSTIFSSEVPPGVAVPLFCEHFDPRFFHITSSPSDGQFLVAFNHSPKLYRKFINSGGEPRRAVLIRLEPDSVFPAQYTSRITDKYGLVLSPGSSRKISTTQIQLGWPYQYHLNPATPVPTDPSLIDILDSNNYENLFALENWEKRSHLLTMIAGNKVSPVSRANYALRRQLAKELPTDLLEVYGPLWEGALYPKVRHRLAVLVATIRQGTFPNLREIYGNLFQTYSTAKGVIANKHELLQGSKFSLVIENSNTIVTEKIFDSIINGAIPIYVGPVLSEVGLPVKIAIPIKGSADEVLEIVTAMDPTSVGEYLLAMSTFIKRANFRENWVAELAYKKMATRVIQYFEGVNA